MSTALVAGIGLLLGVRHAADPDHLAAVAVCVSRERSTGAAVAIGAMWGVGHALSLLAAGTLIVVSGLAVPPPLALFAELAVAAMLVALGVANLRPRLEHARPDVRGAWRALFVGTVHGLAGSAGATLLIVATIDGTAPALLHLALFGAGGVLGMIASTVTMSLPLTVLGERVAPFHRHIVRATGIASIGIGIALAWQLWAP